MQSRKVTPNEAGQRMDKLLIKILNKAPKSFIYKMLRKKNITLNDKKSDGSEKLAVGDEIKLWLSDETIEKFSENTMTLVADHLDIIYEDSDLLVINKACGALSQKAFASDISVNEEILSYMVRTNQASLSDFQSFHPSVCHRLDRNTSGLLMAGKTMVGLQDMSELIRSRKIGKYYCCLVAGRVSGSMTIKGWLVKDEAANKVTVLKERVPGSDAIETRYKPLGGNDRYTLLQVQLITGRSHQIRAHLSAMGHPIIGDQKYGTAGENTYFYEKYHLKYQLLHCMAMAMPGDTLRLKNIAGKTFFAPIPSLFRCILEGEGLKAAAKLLTGEDHGNMEFQRP